MIYLVEAEKEFLTTEATGFPIPLNKEDELKFRWLAYIEAKDILDAIRISYTLKWLAADVELEPRIHHITEKIHTLSDSNTLIEGGEVQAYEVYQ